MCLFTVPTPTTPAAVASADVTSVVSGTVSLLLLLVIGAVVLVVFFKLKKKKVDPKEETVKPNSDIRPKSRIAVSIMDVENDVTSPRDVTVSENEAVTSSKDAGTETDAAGEGHTDLKVEDGSNDLLAVPDVAADPEGPREASQTDVASSTVAKVPKIDTDTDTSPRDDKTDKDTSRSKKSKNETSRSKKSKNTPRSKKKK